MRKISAILLVMFLLGALVVPVSAAGPVSYDSTVNVTNTTSSAGNISLAYYNPDGTVAATYSDTIAAYETKWYVTLPGLSSAFDGSMVISSSVPLGSMSTIVGKDGSDVAMAYAGYDGFSQGSTSVYLPLLMDSNYGFSTFYSVQNVSSSPVNVTITYSDGLSVPAITGLQPNASAKIDNQAEAHTAMKFSGQLTATGAIAVSVVEWGNDSYGNPILSYNGFPSGSTNPVIPIVNQNNYGYWTAIPIQNLGSVATAVTLTYTKTKGSGTNCTETITIPANSQVEFGSYAFVFTSTPPYTVVSTCVMGQTFIGNAVVTGNSTSQPLVSLANQSTTIDPLSDKGAALMGLDPSNASSVLVFPDVRQWHGTDHWWTSITLTNLSGASLPIGDVSCRAVGTGPGGPVNLTFSNPAAIPDDAAWLVDFYPGLVPPNTPSPLPDGFVGGVVCTSATGELVGNANNLGHTAAANLDSLITYEGINQ